MAILSVFHGRRYRLISKFFLQVVCLQLVIASQHVMSLSGCKTVYKYSGRPVVNSYEHTPSTHNLVIPLVKHAMTFLATSYHVILLPVTSESCRDLSLPSSSRPHSLLYLVTQFPRMATAQVRDSGIPSSSSFILSLKLSNCTIC
jgi:hypothetical protein